MTDLATVQRAVLGLGTAATQNTGTSGATIPILNVANTWGAAQTFSSGIIFANETMLTYDEGTWTPGMAFGGSSTGVTYGVQEGYYTKSGNVVNLWGQVTLTNNGSGTGNGTVTGLPFTSKTITNAPVQISVPRWGPGVTLTANYTFVGLNVTSNATTATFIQSGSGQTSAGMDDTVMGNTTAVYFSGTYPASTS